MSPNGRSLVQLGAVALLLVVGVWLLIPTGESASMAAPAGETSGPAASASSPSPPSEPGVSEACLKCGAASCAEEQKGCSVLSGTATDGFRKGASRVQLCEEVLACVRKTGCAPGARGVGHECYCGGDDVQKCITEATPHGPCKEVIEAAGESNSPMEVGKRWGNHEFAVGAAFRRVRCEAQRCRTECFPGAKPEAR